MQKVSLFQSQLKAPRGQMFRMEAFNFLVTDITLCWASKLDAIPLILSRIRDIPRDTLSFISKVFSPWIAKKSQLFSRGVAHG